MFFRDKKSSSGYVLQLVESFRNEEGQPRQRVVVSLGDAVIDHNDRAVIARAVEANLSGACDFSFAEPDSNVTRWTDRIVRLVRSQNRRVCAPELGLDVIDGVLANQVTHDSPATLGTALAAVDAWRHLDMDTCLRDLGFNDSQRLAAAVNIINRLIDPLSENLLGDWVQTTALAELLGDSALRSPRDRFYRVSDKLVDKRRAIETHLRSRQKDQFGLERTVVLYDLTNTYFEGTSSANPKAKRGKSKEKRDDCPQLVVGMVFDEYGFELAHEIFEGATSDSKTLQVILDLLDKSCASDEQLASVKPMVIMDGGVATIANRKLLRKRGYNYLVNETRTSRTKWKEQFAQETAFSLIEGRQGKSAVKVRLIDSNSDDFDEQILLCKSDGRREKEQAIRSGAEVRFLKQMEALAKRIETGKLKDMAKIQQAIGRVQAANSRVRRFYEIELRTQPLRLVWSSKQQMQDEDDELLGCYVLRSDKGGFQAQQLWEVYMMLSRAEEGFRCLKGDLGLRPVRHHKQTRCDGHIFISIIAYHLLRNILYRLEAAGDHRSWQTIRRILRTHVYATVQLPTATNGTWRIRNAGEPDQTQKEIYIKLAIDWNRLPVTREHLPATI